MQKNIHLIFILCVKSFKRVALYASLIYLLAIDVFGLRGLLIILFTLPLQSQSLGARKIKQKKTFSESYTSSLQSSQRSCSCYLMEIRRWLGELKILHSVPLFQSLNTALKLFTIKRPCVK